MLKATYVSEDRAKAETTVSRVKDSLLEMKSPSGAKKLDNSNRETLTFFLFQEQYCLRLRTKNKMESLTREIKRCSRGVGAFPNGYSTVCRQIDTRRDQ